jgi:cytochrome c peroxidase
MGMSKVLLRILAGFLLIFMASCHVDPIFGDGDTDPDPNPNGWVYNPTYVALTAPIGFPPIDIPADNPQTQQGILLGRMLFYDPILSGDSTQACASCHKQQFAFSDGGVKFSKGIDQLEGSRNSMPLFNLVYNSSFFWDGRSPNLEDQVQQPVVNPVEMHAQWSQVVDRLKRGTRYPQKFYEAFGVDTNEITPAVAAKALSQFVRTMISANSSYDQHKAGGHTMSDDAVSGFELFVSLQGGDCFHCHGDGDGNRLFLDNSVSKQFRNNGLNAATSPGDFADAGRGGVTGLPQDYGKFKVPSLRNVALTGPYMHDGRFQTLEEVVDFYSDSVHAGPFTDPLMEFQHQGGAHLTPVEKYQLVEFLKSLTDESLTTNPALSNPF